MNMLFTSGTTGVPKAIPYGREKMDKLKEVMDDLIVIGKVGGTEENPVNTYSFFPMTVPNLGFWQTTQLSKYPHIRHFDVGGTPIELVYKLFEFYPPNLIAGLPKKLEEVVSKTEPKLLKSLNQVVTGGEAATMELVELVKKLSNTELLSIYGMTETGICFVTEFGKREEGYIIKHAKVEIKDDEIIVNGYPTGDLGSINKFGKLDLGIVRIKDKAKFCGINKEEE